MTSEDARAVCVELLLELALSDSESRALYPTQLLSAFKGDVLIYL